MRRTTTLSLTTAAALALSGLHTGSAEAAPGGIELADFRVPDQYRAGTVAMVSVIADFTNDGFNDVAVGSVADKAVKVFRGTGTGKLRVPTSIEVLGGAGAFDLAAADFTGDGTLDLAVIAVSAAASAVVVLAGNGDGSFQQVDTIPAGAGDVTSADFDGDGYIDLAFSHGSSSGDVIKVALNDGTGQFGPVDTYEPPFFLGYDALTARDVNGDAAPDLVFLGGCPKVRLNLGDGTFGPEICSTDPQGRIGGITLALDDFDGDGYVDLATGNASGGRVSIAKGDGTGRFAFFRMYEDVSRQITSIVSAELTGDGELDLLADSNTGGSELLTGNGDATFDPPVDWILGGSSLTVGQLGGSALPDVVSAGGLSLNEISVTLNSGNGRFEAPRKIAAGGRATGLEVGDVDNDGQDDVAIVIDSSNLMVHRSSGGRPRFLTPVESPLVGGDTLTIRLADMDEDGSLDVVGTLDTEPNLFVAIGNGDGSFDQPERHDNGGTSAGGLAVADVTGDGHLDVVTATSTQISVAPGDGEGSLGAPILSGQSAGSTQRSLVADLDGDGDLDVVGAIRTGGATHPGMRLIVNLNDGEGSFAAAYQRVTNSNLTGAAIGDLDGDGFPEVAVTGTRSSPRPGRRGLFVWANESGVLAESPTYYESPDVGILLADANLDGTLDAVTRGGNTIGIHLNGGDGTFQRLQMIPLAADQLALDQGDLTGDGKVDFVVTYGSIEPSTFAAYANQTR